MLYTLLESEYRPLPQDPTHYVSVDILNRDLSIKRVTIFYNPADNWCDEAPVFLDAERNIGKLISDNLKFIGEDKNAAAFKAYIIEIKSQKVIHTTNINYFPNKHHEKH